MLGVMLNRLASALLGQSSWSLPVLSLREATSPRGRSGPSGCSDKPGPVGGRRVLALWPSSLALRTVAIVLSSMFTPNLSSLHHQEPENPGSLDPSKGQGTCKQE